MAIEPYQGRIKSLGSLQAKDDDDVSGGHRSRSGILAAVESLLDVELLQRWIRPAKS